MGPGLGRRGHQRHVRPAPRAALEADRQRGGNRRPRAGPADELGPPEAAGRWSLVDRRPADSPTERLHAQSLALLERHGVLTREAVASEGIEGGFSAVYPILRAMEEAGRIRRGYFVEGLGRRAVRARLARWTDCAPCATAATRLAGEAYLLAATDPANPFGARPAWPRRGEADRRPLQRAAGAYVVIVDGAAAMYLERGGSTLQTLAPADDPDGAGARASGRSAGSSSTAALREVVIRKVDGVAGRRVAVRARRSSPPASRPGYRGLILRAAR